jgi:hypothetical protein
MAKGDPRAGQGGGYFPNLYQSTVAQTGQDYDNIMNQYRQLASRSSGNSPTRLSFSPVAPSLAQYQSGSSSGSDSLRNFTQTGGYSDADIGNIRARAISPIRSIYANARMNVDRQRALQGGYSPNYTAATAKMAREQSSLLSDKVGDINASIAEMVQRGKLAGATSLAPLELRETEMRNQFERDNVDAVNRANIFNAQMPLQYEQFNRQADDNEFNQILQSIEGQRNLYGTTPALQSTFGNQVLNAANTVNSFPPIIRGNTSPGGFTAGMGSRFGGIGEVYR